MGLTSHDRYGQLFRSMIRGTGTYLQPAHYSFIDWFLLTMRSFIIFRTDTSWLGWPCVVKLPAALAVVPRDRVSAAESRYRLVNCYRRNVLSSSSSSLVRRWKAVRPADNEPRCITLSGSFKLRANVHYWGGGGIYGCIATGDTDLVWSSSNRGRKRWRNYLVIVCADKFVCEPFKFSIYHCKFALLLKRSKRLAGCRGSAFCVCCFYSFVCVIGLSKL